MSYAIASGSCDFYHNAGNLLLKNHGPNKIRPQMSGVDTVLKWLHEQPQFSDFLSLVYTANLQDKFDNIMSDLTVFAPTNEALARHPDLLVDLNRAKARGIVNHHITKDVPLCLTNISNHLYEVYNPVDVSMTVDGRNKPFRVGYNEIGGMFGLEWITVADMVSDREWITKNGVIHPINDCIYPNVELIG